MAWGDQTQLIYPGSRVLVSEFDRARAPAFITPDLPKYPAQVYDGAAAEIYSSRATPT